MRVYITGADGFIGSHLTEKLLKSNYKVTALCQYNSFNSLGWLNDIPNYHNTKNLNIIHGDIRDAYFIEETTKKVDIVLHLASLISIPYSYVAPKSYFDTNVIGAYNIAQAVKKNKIKKLIHTSTSEVYGSAQYVPIDEKHPLVGQSPYSASKISADQLIYSFYCSYNLPCVTLRPFNTYGPRQSNRAIIPTIISQILNNSKFTELGNLNSTRDFNFIDDTVDAFYKTIISKNENIYGQTINIGSGYEISIRNLFLLISEIIGISSELKIKKERLRPGKSEVNRLLADNKLAKDLVGWQPKYKTKDGLKKGLKKTIKWFSNNQNLKNYYNNYSI